MPSAIVLRFYVMCMRHNFSCRKGGYSYIGLKDIVNNFPFHLSKEIKKATDLKNVWVKPKFHVICSVKKRLSPLQLN